MDDETQSTWVRGFADSGSSRTLFIDDEWLYSDQHGDESAPAGVFEEEAEDQPHEVAPAHDEAHERETISGLSRELKSTAKSRSSDSVTYRQTVLSLEAVNNIMSRTVTPDNYPDISTEAVSRYAQLLIDCRIYLERHSGRRWTDTGKARVAIVRSIQTISQRDMRALSTGDGIAAAHPGGITLMQLIGEQARTVSVNLDDGRQVREIGAGSSTRLRFDEGGKPVFFTREEILFSQADATNHVISEIQDDNIRNMFAEINSKPATSPNLISKLWLNIANNPDYLEIENMGRANPYLSLPDVIRDKVARGPLLAVTQKYGFDFNDDESCRQFKDICVLTARASNGANNFSKMGSIAEGSNLSVRNAAMSRLAELLGIGTLLARSTTAEILYQQRTIRGNMMEMARGESIPDLDSAQLQNADLSSADLQRDLICLQFLDALCGQVDRNIGNFFATTERDEDGNVTRFTGVQGIDNDMSFGNIVDLAKFNSELPPILTRQGGSVLPVVDRQLGERLLQITPDMLTFAVSDIITSEVELGALRSRLGQIQQALRALKEQDGVGGQKTFLDLQDWGETSRQALMNQAAGAPPNYYSDFVRKIRGQAGNQDLGNTPASGQATGGPVAVKSYVMEASTLSFLLNRGDVSIQDRRNLEGMLVELLDTYHRAERSGDFRRARAVLTRITEVSQSRRGELNKSAARKMLDTLKAQCLTRLAQMSGLPVETASESLFVLDILSGVTELAPGEIVGLSGEDPFPEYTRFTSAEAMAMSQDNRFNQGAYRDILYGDRKGTHGDKHGYILTDNSSTINRNLRGVGTMTEQSRQTVELLDQAAVSDRIPRKTRFHRMIGTDYLKYALGMRNEVEDNVVKSENATQINKMAGTVINESGFMCVGYMIDAMFASHPVMLTILCDEGTPVFPTSNHAESEMIFGRGTSYMILGAKLHGMGANTEYPLSSATADSTVPMTKAIYRGLEIFVKIIKR